uniref:Uncharacterized protein n=1 Tax=Vibrio sp. FF_304 TaxID=1652833 RepID=A0A0H3ZIT1_9VIBR|nr:hypothetical protein [Vibrio sp. FF_304]
MNAFSILKLSVVTALIFISFSYGFLANHYKIFPYDQIKSLKVLITGVTSDCEFCGPNPKMAGTTGAI